MSHPSASLPTLMAREAAEAPQAVARLIAANAAACRALGERLRRKPPHFVGHLRARQLRQRLRPMRNI